MNEDPSGSSNLRHTRPPGLSGREIGLYYRNLRLQSKSSDKEAKETRRIQLHASVDIPSSVLPYVEKCLKEFEDGDEEERVCDEFANHFHTLRDISFEEFLENTKTSTNKTLDVSEWNISLKNDFLHDEKSEEFHKLYKMREKLPALMQKSEILKAIEDNQVVLIVGSTGCGKTTQIPQILLDECITSGRGGECNIICTQPRRISAVSVAERVAYERNEKLGISVGYKIRLERCEPRSYGSILYCTSGILLQMMQSNPLVYGTNYIILDEIHERSVETDLLMGLFKKVLPLRPDLKVILMSATVSEETFCQYFNNCFTLHIEGTLFPVEVLYLEDILQETGFTSFGNNVNYPEKADGSRKRNRSYSNMILPYMIEIQGIYSKEVVTTISKFADSEGCENLYFLECLIFHICKTKPAGAILVFLPGYEQISKLAGILQDPSNYKYRELSKSIEVHGLHSMLPTVDQKDIFNPASPGKRKVILSTTLAETSVTIEDVVYVINTGRIKYKKYDVAQNIEELQEAWVSKANTKQRKGRAGRVQPGICYNLFTRIRERNMLEVPLPEILCSKLESIILNLKLLHISDPYEFFKTLISAPEEKAVIHGLSLLKRIDALDDNGNLTPLGIHLAHLPADPQMGKMTLMAALFRCLDPITSVAAGLSYKSPFHTPLGLEKKVIAVKHQLSNSSRSDHLLTHSVIEGYRHAKECKNNYKYCHANFLRSSTIFQIENMKTQFATLLKNSSFLETADCRDKNSNMNSKDIPLLRAMIAAGLYPNIAFLSQIKQRKNHCNAIHIMSTPENESVKFHRSSINDGYPSFEFNYFVYFQKLKTGAVYLLDATMVSPMALLIFGDAVKRGETERGESYISVADTYSFKCNEETSLLILKLREKLQRLLQKKALYPSPIKINSKDEHLIKAIQIMLSLDDTEYNVALLN